MIVLDASAAIAWLFQSPAGLRIDKRIFSSSESLHAPHLLDVEVAQVLRRYVREKTISKRRGEEALEDFGDLPLNRYPHDFLLPRVWELRATLTAYEAVYVALAELLDAPLLTCDSKVASASGHHASIEMGVASCHLRTTTRVRSATRVRRISNSMLTARNRPLLLL